MCARSTIFDEGTGSGAKGAADPLIERRSRVKQISRDDFYCSRVHESRGRVLLERSPFCDKVGRARPMVCAGRRSSGGISCGGDIAPVQVLASRQPARSRECRGRWRDGAKSGCPAQQLCSDLPGQHGGPVWRQMQKGSFVRMRARNQVYPDVPRKGGQGVDEVVARPLMTTVGDHLCGDCMRRFLLCLIRAAVLMMA